VKGVELEIRLVKSDDERDEIFRIRKQVFVDEQQVPIVEECDSFEESSDHFIVCLGSTPIGCARVRIIENVARLERIALLREFRREGYGTKLMEYLIDYCTRQEVDEIIIHAQWYVRGFYEKLGFVPRGEIFQEAGIDHIEMYLEPGSISA